MRKIAIILVFLLSVCLSHAQEKQRHNKVKKAEAIEEGIEYPDEYVDTVNIKKSLTLNDYSMIGVEYGVSRNCQKFVPGFEQTALFFPDYYGITYTRYGKLIGIPVVGFQIGVFMGHEGYQFKTDEKTGAVFTINNASKVVMKCIEVPFLAEGHYDLSNFKFLLNIGPYAGYRLNIQRYGPQEIDPGIVSSFLDYERRFDYGFHGGVGFSLVFEPVEFQVKLRVKYSMSSLWEPDFNSIYYYRYAYPLDFMLTGGLHFHLTKRYGKTKASLKRDAREAVFNPKPVENENN